MTELSKRQLAILSAVVSQYSLSGEPVGSKAIQAAFDGQISSATIRSEMGELSELGYLEQPHTSAGRVPTSRGYRLYIDRLMPRQTLSDIQRRAIDDILPADDDPERLLGRAARQLAELTNLAALSTTSTGQGATLLKAQAFLMSEQTALLVAVSGDGVIRNKVCRCDFPITEQMLQAFHRLIDRFLLGRPLGELSRAAAQTLAAGGGEYLLELTPLIVGLFDLIVELSELDLKLGGETNLLKHREYDGGRGKELLDFLSHHDMVLPLLVGFEDSVGVMLGSDTPIKALSDSSMVIAHYSIGDRPAGKIGIIGPMRMNYSSLIPALSYFAGKLGLLMRQATENMEGDTNSAKEE